MEQDTTTRYKVDEWLSLTLDSHSQQPASYVTGVITDTVHCCDVVIGLEAPQSQIFMTLACGTTVLSLTSKVQARSWQLHWQFVGITFKLEKLIIVNSNNEFIIFYMQLITNEYLSKSNHNLVHQAYLSCQAVRQTVYLSFCSGLCLKASALVLTLVLVLVLALALVLAFRFWPWLHRW